MTFLIARIAAIIIGIANNVMSPLPVKVVFDHAKRPPASAGGRLVS